VRRTCHRTPQNPRAGLVPCPLFVISEKVKTATESLAVFLEDHYEPFKILSDCHPFVRRFALDFHGLPAVKRQFEYHGYQ